MTSVRGHACSCRRCETLVTFFFSFCLRLTLQHKHIKHTQCIHAPVTHVMHSPRWRRLNKHLNTNASWERVHACGVSACLNSTCMHSLSAMPSFSFSLLSVDAAPHFTNKRGATASTFRGHTGQIFTNKHSQGRRSCWTGLQKLSRKKKNEKKHKTHD